MVRPSDFLIGVVDNHVQTAVEISQSLEFVGFQTFQSYNFKDAVLDITSKKPFLVLTDVRLDYGEEGYTLMEKFPQQKFVFVSMIEPPKSREKKNVVGYLKKPVAGDEVVAMVKKILHL